jgi:hypothetical protein
MKQKVTQIISRGEQTRSGDACEWRYTLRKGTSTITKNDISGPGDIWKARKCT